MTDAFLATVFLFMGIFGYWTMNQVDRFLKEHVKKEKGEEDEQQQR